MKLMTKQERDEQIVANLGLVHLFVRRIMVRRSVPEQYLEDVMQAGTMGLMRALEKFDLERGTKLSTYAFWWVRIFANRAIQGLSDRYSAIVEEYEDNFAAPVYDVDDALMLQRLHQQIARLPQNLRVLVLRRMDGETLLAIGNSLGISRERVRQLESLAHRKLRELVFPRGCRSRPGDLARLEA